ncbi:MAG: helix-turn-helix transcriptional regulator [Erysipelotrichaceae bacterium]|nr:helix-turn-helix transcriptional regulator [Erysipelotrichaceae bacterium]
MLSERNGYELVSHDRADDLLLVRMRKWRDYLDEHTTLSISLDDLAKEGQLSVTYISHLFRDYFGISFQEYLNNLRFEKALYLLNSTKMPVFDLALAAGFSDPKYLNEQFRKHFGCSVKTYRRSNTESFDRNEKRPSLSEKISYDEEALRLLDSLC